MELKDVKRINPETYSTKKVAEFLKVSSATLFNMIKSGRIKVINIAKTGKRPIYGITAEAVQSYYDNLNQVSNTSQGN